MKPLSPLAAYVVLWGASMPLELARGALVARGPMEVALALLCVGACLAPENSTVTALAMAFRVAWWLGRLPFTWDSEVLAALTDLAVVLHFIAAESEHPKGGVAKSAALVAGVGASIRRQLGWFYLAAGFWKLNTSFVDPRYSCASIYAAQLVDAYAPRLGAARPALALVRAAPAVTLVLECGVGLCMLARAYLPAPRLGALGVLLATLLHAGIDLTPPPNNIAVFSHKAALRAFWFAPKGTAAAVNEALARPLTLGGAYAALGAAALAATVAAQRPELWVAWTAAPLASLRALDARAVDWHVGAHASLSALLLRGLWISWSKSTSASPRAKAGSPKAAATAAAKPPGAAAASKPAAATAAGAAGCSPLVHFNTLLCVLWAFGAVALGALEMSTPNMFANLRAHGGTNHLLGAPTGLLQRWRYAGPAVGDDPFGGGVVRVEASAAARVDGVFPAELTAVLAPGAVTLLRGANHSGRHFNSAIAHTVGPAAVPPRADGAPFVPYTLPAFELRRALRDARAAGGPFELEYTSLPGASGDEHWRANARGRTIRLTVTPSGERCTVLDAGDGGDPECRPDDLALAPFPRRDFVARPFCLLYTSPSPRDGLLSRMPSSA